MSVIGGLVDALIRDDEVAAHFSEEAEIAAMLRVEVALARAQAGLGIIERQAAEDIAEVSATLRPDLAAIRSGMARDGVPVPALVKALRSALGEPYGADVHKGATSQDIIDTGLMLRLQTVFGLFEERLDSVIRLIDETALDQGLTSLMAHTRMQAALPFTGADKLATWRQPLQSHRARLIQLRQDLPIQLGGPIGTGDSFGTQYRRLRADMAQALALRDAAPWHSDRTVVLDAAQAFATLTGTMGKIGQDLGLMAQAGTVALAGGGTSSAMAHKQNPVGAELLVTLARLNAGLLGTVAQSMVHENERSGAAWTLEWLALPQMACAAGSALLRAQQVLSGLQFHATRG